MNELGSLSAVYESNGDPACVSSGVNDAGGISYGTYQLASNCGSVDEFLGWGLRQGGFYTDYARTLVDSGEINSDEFIDQWKELGTIDRQGFAQMQHDYIKAKYYDVACKLLQDNLFHVDKHSDTLKDVIWSRTVQYGVGNIVDMFNDALKLMEKALNLELPNLSYVDDKRFDYDIIACIYDVCMSTEWNNSALRDNLNERFADEKFRALEMLQNELNEV